LLRETIVGFRQIVERVRDALHLRSAPYVLCADDDDAVRELCAIALKRAGYDVDEAVNGREAREKLERNKYSAVLLDMNMPYLHGATLLSLLQRQEPDMLRRVIVVTGMADAVLVDVQPLVAAVLRKPLTIDQIVGAVSDCCAFDDTIVSRRDADAMRTSSEAR
jgi:two-component system chemotaxis response regulator CheY